MTLNPNYNFQTKHQAQTQIQYNTGVKIII
jgi:hypothetical protein